MLKDQLTRLRKSRGKTQEDIAKILGITRPAYTAYEIGTRQPDYESLIKLAKYFDVTIDYLLTGEKEETESNPNLFFFDMGGLTKEEIEDIKSHYKYVKWKSKHGGKNE
ncbi:helix-turn-helix transcriptional regulator [Sporolactobacillus shoreicorticis]|uniref:Helix-turn-helix domain-containing protein n=1 Tax=Sporolactobacillus shoreicorticis TaxID=1923877 RepID=A0ABW5RXJ1_9BACL|nr:helix-turn-helix transcriptional regulator [Sporolactobacillus shoreicorticis]MCO7124770.1 helix-turn-helix transcriptional regulator [Sporolactobacillus shoreicorticis]